MASSSDLMKHKVMKLQILNVPFVLYFSNGVVNVGLRDNKNDLIYLFNINLIQPIFIDKILPGYVYLFERKYQRSMFKMMLNSIKHFYDVELFPGLKNAITTNRFANPSSYEKQMKLNFPYEVVAKKKRILVYDAKKDDNLMIIDIDDIYYIQPQHLKEKLYEKYEQFGGDTNKNAYLLYVKMVDAIHQFYNSNIVSKLQFMLDNFKPDKSHSMLKQQPITELNFMDEFKKQTLLHQNENIYF